VLKKYVHEGNAKANTSARSTRMSKALGAGFDLDRIFKMATDHHFRSTPADEWFALASDGLVTETKRDNAKLFPIAHAGRAMKNWKRSAQDDLGARSSGKVMKDRVAICHRRAAENNRRR